MCRDGWEEGYVGKSMIATSLVLQSYIGMGGNRMQIGTFATRLFSPRSYSEGFRTMDLSGAPPRTFIRSVMSR